MTGVKGAMDIGIVKLLFVGLGGAVGSIARYLVNISPLQSQFEKFPAPTFLINVVGSFLMGLCVMFLTQKIPLSENVRLFILVGFLGAFTTFSTFELEIWELLVENRIFAAIMYAGLSLAIGLIGLMLGVFVAKRF